LDRARDFAMRQMWEPHTIAYALSQIRRYPITKEMKVTYIAGYLKPKESRFIRHRWHNHSEAQSIKSIPIIRANSTAQR
jgi:hypothetical protein